MNKLLAKQGWIPKTIALALLLIALPVSAQDWLFARSDYSHDPYTGERTVQFAKVQPIEGLPDPRATTSRYWTRQTRLRGANGGTDTVYEVRSFEDAQGRDYARWERSFDAWKEAASIAGPFWAGPFWPGGTPAPGLDYQNQGYGTGGYALPPYGYGGYASGPYAGFGPNGYFGGPNVPFGVSPYGYGFAPYRPFPYHYHKGHHGGGHHGGGHGGGGHHGGGHGGGSGS